MVTVDLNPSQRIVWHKPSSYRAVSWTGPGWYRNVQPATSASADWWPCAFGEAGARLAYTVDALFASAAPVLLLPARCGERAA